MQRLVLFQATISWACTATLRGFIQARAHFLTVSNDRVVMSEPKVRSSRFMKTRLFGPGTYIENTSSPVSLCTIQPSLAISVIMVDVLAPITPGSDVVDGTSEFNTQRAGQVRILAEM